jgi:zinc transport system substrate-binding protein
MDPHTWLSPALAKQMAEHMKTAFIEADPSHQTDYEANYNKLAGRLDGLAKTYKDTLSPLPHKDIVVQHDAFSYLCRDFGLTQHAIMGLTPDAEPTAQKMKEVKDFVEQKGVKYIFFEELVSDKLAKSLAKEVGVETMVLNPLEGLTKKQLDAGDDYFTVMERNLHNLVKALQ